MNTDKIIFYATKKYTNQMVNLMRDRFQANTGMSDEAFKKLKYYFQIDLARVVTVLVYKDIEELNSIVQSKGVKNLRVISGNKQIANTGESNIVKQESSAVIIKKAVTEFKLMLDAKIRSVLMFPFFVITIASRDQSKVMSIATNEIRELMDEVNRLMLYKKIVDRKGTPREEFAKKILIVIDRLKKTPGKLTITKISKEFTPKRTTFYGMLEKHRIEINENFEIIDKKTQKPFEFR